MSRSHSRPPSPHEITPACQNDLSVIQLGWLAAAVFVVSAGYGALMPLIPDWLRSLMADVDPRVLSRHVGYLSLPVTGNFVRIV